MEQILIEVLKISPAVGVMLYLIWSQNKRASDRETWLENLYEGLRKSLDDLSAAIREQRQQTAPKNDKK